MDQQVKEAFIRNAYGMAKTFTPRFFLYAQNKHGCPSPAPNQGNDSQVCMYVCNNVYYMYIDMYPG